MPTSVKKKPITLALQGGGSHGAFTWGVLDKLLEDGRLLIEGISGTSAGALNAIVLAQGYEIGGTEGARDKLQHFWKSISRKGTFGLHYWNLFHAFGADWSPWNMWFDFLTQAFSPYQMNPFNINPLREMLKEIIDFDHLRKCGKIRLFISATNVNTNQLHIFTNSQISLDVLMASSCLPHLHHAVEINGEYYWDGGFMGNPVLEPLVRQCETSDIVIVQINPTIRQELPQNAVDIADRINEITFNSNLMREIRSYIDLTKMIDQGYIHDPRVERVFLHLIPICSELSYLGVRSKMDSSWALVSRLFALGRKQAENWLAKHFKDLGHRTSLHLQELTPIQNSKMNRA